MNTSRLIAALLLLLTLQACGGGGSYDEPEAEKATTGPVDCKANPKQCI